MTLAQLQRFVAKGQEAQEALSAIVPSQIGRAHV